MVSDPQAQAKLQQTLQTAILQEREQAEKRQVAWLSTVVEVANLLLRTADYKTVLPDVMRLLGEAARSDRCLIIRELPDPETGNPWLEVLAEWARNGVAAVSAEIPEGEPQLVVDGDWADLHGQLQCGELTNYIVAEMPEPWRGFLEAQGVVSSASVPITVDGQCWGHIEFDSCSEARLYDATEIGILQTAAEMIAGAIVRTAQDEALRESEERYRTLFEISSEGVYRFEFDEPIPIDLPVDEQVELVYRHYRTVSANATYAAMYNLDSPEDLIGLRLTDIHITQSSQNQRMMRAFVENGYQLCNAETEEVDLEGNSRYLLNNITTVIKDGYAISGWASQLDITERRLAQQALLEAEQDRVAELAKTNQALKNSLDRLAADPDFNAFLGYVLLEMTQQLDLDVATLWFYDAATQTLPLELMVEQGQVKLRDHIQAPEAYLRPTTTSTPVWEILLQTKQPFVVTQENATDYAFQGTHTYQTEQLGLQVGVNFLLRLGDEPIGMLGLASTQHITFTPEALELAQALTQQATLAIQLMRLADEAKHAAIFEERNRLAGEIHDTLAQAFTGISLQLGVANSIAHQDPAETQRILDRALQLAHAGLTEARRAVWSIYPSAAKYTNLCQMLRDATEQLAANVPIQLQIEGEPYTVPALLGLNLTRMAQEAITNALKHAQATTIQVVLTYEPQDLYLRISDDGCGFSPQSDGGGFGLMSLSQRSERIGGELDIHSQLMQGTEIVVHVNLGRFTQLLQGAGSQESLSRDLNHE